MAQIHVNSKVHESGSTLCWVRNSKLIYWGDSDSKWDSEWCSLLRPSVGVPHLANVKDNLFIPSLSPPSILSLSLGKCLGQWRRSQTGGFTQQFNHALAGWFWTANFLSLYFPCETEDVPKPLRSFEDLEKSYASWMILIIPWLLIFKFHLVTKSLASDHSVSCFTHVHWVLLHPFHQVDPARRGHL